MAARGQRGLRSGGRLHRRRAPLAAEAVVERIIRSAELLRRHPGIGRPGRTAGTREWPVRGTPFVLLYRTGAERVEILRLLHHAQRG